MKVTATFNHQEQLWLSPQPPGRGAERPRWCLETPAGPCVSGMETVQVPEMTVIVDFCVGALSYKVGFIRPILQMKDLRGSEGKQLAHILTAGLPSILAGRRCLSPSPQLQDATLTWFSSQRRQLFLLAGTCIRSLFESEWEWGGGPKGQVF